MVTKDVQANLRKYKMEGGRGRTPSRRGRSRSRGGAEGEEAVSGQGSPTKVQFEGFDKQGRKSIGGDDSLAASRAIRESLKELDNGIGEKSSLLKMLVIKCDEADQNYNRLRNYINFGELENADR